MNGAAKKAKGFFHGLHAKYGTKYIAWMTLLIMGVNVFLSSLTYYYAEGLDSWYRSVYWTITTISTVGYGDETPVTYVGMTVAMLNMIIGVALFPAIGGLIIGFMNDFWQQKKEVSREELKSQNAQIIKQNDVIIAQNAEHERLLKELMNGKQP